MYPHHAHHMHLHSDIHACRSHAGMHICHMQENVHADIGSVYRVKYRKHMFLLTWTLIHKLTHMYAPHGICTYISKHALHMCITRHIQACEKHVTCIYSYEMCTYLIQTSKQKLHVPLSTIWPWILEFFSLVCPTQHLSGPNFLLTHCPC